MIPTAQANRLAQPRPFCSCVSPAHCNPAAHGGFSCWSYRVRAGHPERRLSNHNQNHVEHGAWETCPADAWGR